MSLHSAHLSDEVGVLRPDICVDCRREMFEPQIQWNRPATPAYDTATELRIANLLTAAMYPTPLGIDGGDTARKKAMQQALEMLGLLPPQ